MQTKICFGSKAFSFIKNGSKLNENPKYYFTHNTDFLNKNSYSFN